MERALFQAGESNGFAISRDLNPKLVDVNALKPLGRQTRKHPSAQVRKLGESLEQFGFVLPIVIDADQRVVGGWGLVLAARKIGLDEIPAVTVTDLDEAKLRLLRLALNRLGEESSWDVGALKLEFSDVVQITSDIDLRISGFEMGEIDVALSTAEGDEEDVLPAANESEPPITKPGDLWILGDHRLLCGDALVAESYVRLLGDDRAQMVFTDPPWNIPIAGNVSGLGAVKHDDFAMACGEMTETQFEIFLRTSLGHAAAYSDDGAIQFICMHWSKIKEVLAAADVYGELKNLCVWNKTNAGMGSLYRSKHELVFVFKKGIGPHINNIELGRIGRNRTNVWDYPGQNIFNGTAKSKLSLHPTAKPVALVADAIRDCSHRCGIVLDPFGGVGATLIGAEKTGRKARLIELDPRYVDATVKRWETLTGARAVKTNAAGTILEADRHSGGEDAASNDAVALASGGGAS
jgi:DNA modification methylase